MEPWSDEMDLAALVDNLGITVHGPKSGIGGLRIDALTDDSRQVRTGSLFVARLGTKADGAAFVGAAVQAGAVAVLTDRVMGDVGVPVLVASQQVGLAKTAALVAERLYGAPTSSLELVGITGTNGKTTTAHLCQQILRHSGSSCGLIGTVLVDDGRTAMPALWTTPPSHVLSETFAKMVGNGCRAAAMEVSSHALHQDRVAALNFRVGVFTNLTGDHLDYHGSIEAYGLAKARLFAMLPEDGTAIVNAEDPWHAPMIEQTRAKRVWPCRLSTGTGEHPPRRDECVVREIAQESHGARVAMRGPWGEIETFLPLVGAFNLMNALQASAAAWATGLVTDAKVLARSIEAVTPPPGRLERVSELGSPFVVLVDYAHTDDALAKAIAAVRPVVGDHGRLVVIFGCGGDRDRTKRPRMGRVAAELADVAWITSDNPRSEAPGSIIEEIRQGVPASPRARIEIEPDRRVAIGRAIADLRDGDLLLIAGKGHEQGQIVRNHDGTLRTEPFSDQQVAREALACAGMAGGCR